MTEERRYNPYLEEARPYLDPFPPVGGTFSFDSHGLAILESTNKRNELIRKYAWSIPSESFALAIAKTCPRLIEVGAGTGYWAWFLTQYGIDIRGFDLEPRQWGRIPANELSHWVWYFNGVQRKVEPGHYEVALKREHRDRTLFICWAYEYSEGLIKQYDRDYLVRVGEWDGGCTDSPRFFRILNQRYDCIFDEESINWNGIHSHNQIWRQR